MKNFEKLYSDFVKLKNEKRFVPDKNSPIVIDPEARLTFAVFGDPQISSISPVRAVRFSAACEDISNMSSPLDALVIVGDVTEYGREAEYQLTSSILNTASSGFKSFFAVSGNHDVRLRNYRKQVKHFNNFISCVNGGIHGSDEHYFFSREINGYKFIMMGTDSATFEEAYISEKQLEWLDGELKASQNSGKPVFVFNHQALKGTNGLPNTWLGKGDWRGTIGKESDKVRAIFERYKNIIYITGHLHWCLNKYSYENYDAFKAISVPTISVNNHGDYPQETQSFVFSVYDNKIVVKTRIFGLGKYVDEKMNNSTIVIDIDK